MLEWGFEMLNKELLLALKKEAIPKPTHTVEVEEIPYFVGFDANNAYGNINPPDYLGDVILEVTTDMENTVTTVSIQGFLGVSQLYLGRLDTKKVVVLRDVSQSSGTARGPVEFFTYDDVGMDIPIYIGENPPPWA